MENIDHDHEAQRFCGETFKSDCCENGFHADCSGQIIELIAVDDFISHGECECGCHSAISDTENGND